MRSETWPTAVVNQLLAELPGLSARIVARLARDVPSFQMLPDDVLQMEIRPAVDENLMMVFQALRDRSEFSLERLGDPLRRVMSRVEENLSFADVLQAYFIGSRMAWDWVLEHASAADREALHELVAPMTKQMERMFVTATRVYFEEQEHLHSEVGQARRDLAAALLAGDPAEGLETPAGVRVAEGYVVCVWHVARPSPPGTVRSTLVRRRRVRGAFDAEFDTTVLTVLDERGGTGLVPTVPERADDVMATLRRFLNELNGIVGAPVVATAAVAPTVGEVPDAAQEAREVLRVALRLERAPGLYALDDLVLEVQLARPGVANDRLVQRLAPLRSRHELLTTLRAVIEAKDNRRKAASALHVHPNTLAYRLRRIAEVTGLDPADPEGMRVLSAALTAHDLREAASAG
ncbi:helix-turn-helix domain-containing protein [Haloechinothrix salitolerans]|uniref:PucR family transcriptional regulator n=1 Tax=Haloechinothrix salitolerans TaxID=926830 RepID=A0ABW2BZN7_9PSEU